MRTKATAGFLEILELSAKLDGIAVGQLDLFGDLLLRFEDETLHVASAQVHHDGRTSLAVFPRDGCNLLDDLEVSDQAEREQPAVVHSNRQPFKVVNLFPQVLT
jgi:hypothetical protein